MTAPDASRKWRFRLDRYGAPLDADGQKVLGILIPAIERYDAVTAFLGSIGGGVSCLAEAGVLPSENSNQTALTARVDRLRRETSTTLDDPSRRRELQSDIDAMLGLDAAIQTARLMIISVAVLKRLTTNEITLPALLNALDRMLGIPALVRVLTTPADQAPPPSLVNRLKSPQARLVDVLIQHRAIPAVHSADDWLASMRLVLAAVQRMGLPQQPTAIDDRWIERVLKWLQLPAEPLTPPVELDDIEEAARGRFPVAKLRADLGSMTVAEWSDLAREGFARGQTFSDRPNRQDGTGYWPPVAWTFLAALRALGFGRSCLEAWQEQKSYRFQYSPDIDEPFVMGALEQDQPGILHRFVSAADTIASKPPAHDPQAPPIFAVPKASENDYIDVVAWLMRNRAIAVRTAEMEP